MKTIKYLGILFFLVITLGCSNDDSSGALSVTYDQSVIENIFRQEGQTNVPTVNWMGEKGAFSATTLTSPEDDDLVGRVIFIDEATGVISWDTRVPLGVHEIVVTATSTEETATARIIFRNIFKNGFFIGGFNTDTSDEPDYSAIINDTQLILSEGGNVELIATDGSDFDGLGTWTIDGPIVTINFSTNDTPPKEIVMVGYMYASSGDFSGQWGTGLSQDNTVQNVMGVFGFEND